MDISRRKALGLFAGAAGGAGLAGCAAGRAMTDVYSAGLSPVGVSFDHGVASGDAMQDRVVLWTRVTPERPTTEQIPVMVYHSPDRAAVEALETGSLDTADMVSFQGLKTGQGRDYTVKIDLKALQADTEFYYRFAVETPDGMVFSPIGKTRTLPVSGGDELKLGVISCSNYPFGYFNVYKAMAERGDLDAIIHLGDYIYEYGIDGYGAEMGEALNRRHDPVTEIVTLDDYRARHRQYKADANLQAAHAVCPWYCTWDDHESANDSYRTGAQNHNPENGEGDWTDRKQVAVQAYLEWMPVRDPEPGRAKESIYRSVDFGDLVSIFMLESRLTGRSEEISWFTELADVEEKDIPAKAMETMARVASPSRTMLGDVQEGWLADGLARSAQEGKTWQLLANQVIISTVKLPNFMAVLSPEELQLMPEGFGRLMVQFSQLGLPFNLDAWDGFPAARERLFAAAKQSGARLVTITGDTHTAWANEPHSMDGTQIGVEFGCTSVTSPGLGQSIPLPNLGPLMADANEDVTWFDPFGHGYTLLTLSKDKARADFFKVSTIESETFETDLVASFEAEPVEGGISPLRQVQTSS